MGYLLFSSNLTLKKYANFLSTSSQLLHIEIYVVENIEINNIAAKGDLIKHIVKAVDGAKVRIFIMKI